MNNHLVMNALQEAAGLFSRGEFQAALAKAEGTLAVAPDHPEALHLMALALGRLGRLDEAAPVYERTARLHPQKQAVLSNFGNALLAGGRAAEAAHVYRRAVECDPKFVKAWVGLGSALRSAGGKQEAETAFRQALALDPSNVAALNALGSLLSADDFERREEAIELFSQILSLQPRYFLALINRGSLYRERGGFDQALADHEAAVRVAPGHPDALYQLANTQRTRGDSQSARRNYAKALELAPGRADIHREFARFIWESGERETFLQPLAAAIARAPSAALYFLKGELTLRAGRNEDAADAARAILAREEKNGAAYRLLGAAQTRLGELESAETSFRKALSINPHDTASIHDLAALLLQREKFEEAREALKDETAPPMHLQRHIGLKALTLRALDDPGYRRFYDYDRFTAQLDIEIPEGYQSVELFNRDLSDAIRAIHHQQAQPIDQTLYGGTQSLGRLWDEPAPIFKALKQILLKTAAKYVEGLPTDPTHPFLARKSAQLRCAGAWSVILRSGGGHIDHIHPEGWISASYYVEVPEAVSKSTSGRDGFLRLGASGVSGFQMPAERWFQPRAGSVVFFPSYIWHGVEPFTSDEPRITAPFDLTPVEAHV